MIHKLSSKCSTDSKKLGKETNIKLEKIKQTNKPNEEINRGKLKLPKEEIQQIKADNKVLVARYEEEINGLRLKSIDEISPRREGVSAGFFTLAGAAAGTVLTQIGNRIMQGESCGWN